MVNSFWNRILTLKTEKQKKIYIKSLKSYLYHKVRCTKMHHDAPRCRKMHKDAPRCTKMHQDSPICTKLHQDAPRCTNMHQDSPKCTKMHHEAPRCTEMNQIYRDYDKMKSFSNIILALLDLK